MSAVGLQPTGGSRVWLAGVDGCRGGWFAVLVLFASPSPADLRFVLCSSFSQLVSLPEIAFPIAVDTPIGLSKQAFCLIGKIREVDALMQPALQQRIFEAHPELAFAALAGHPMRHNKKTPAGWREREALVAPCFGEHFIEPHAVQERYPRSQVALDDVLDAYALAITASRLHGGSAMRLPGSEPERDSNGLRMEIWY